MISNIIKKFSLFSNTTKNILGTFFISGLVFGMLYFTVVISEVYTKILFGNVATAFLAGGSPQTNYQGKLTESTGVAVPNNTYNVRFKLYATSTGGSPLWSETYCYSPDSGATCDGTGVNSKIQVTSGLFSTMLGSVSSLSGVDFNQVLYLGVEIGGTSSAPTGGDWDGEMSPRKRIGTVPSAFVANSLNGVVDTQLIRADTANSASTSGSVLTLTQTGSGKLIDLYASTTNVFSIGFNGSTTISSLTAGLVRSTSGGALYTDTTSYATSGAITSFITYSYASSTFASTSWVTLAFVPYSYASSTFPTFAYASSTYLPLSASTSLAYIPSASSSIFLSTTTALSTYLKLDASNGPLTNNLNISTTSAEIRLTDGAYSRIVRTSTEDDLSIYNKVSIQAGTDGTGGTITHDGAYTIHTFTSDGTFTPPGTQTAAVLVVAGGGGGGVLGGGGGGGGVVYHSGKTVSGAISVTIGAGGATAANQGVVASDGSNSVFGDITAVGGGGGNSQSSSNSADGGSGGGTMNGSAGVSTQTNSGGGTGYGNAGGTGVGAGASSGGGGGGAGTAGAASSGITGGDGGNGFQSSISGTSTYYGGGGGGGAQCGAGGAGGLGGGVAGSGGAGAVAAAAANTGGGGGSTGYCGAYGTSGAGGSGIVIVKYIPVGSIEEIKLINSKNSLVVGEYGVNIFGSNSGATHLNGGSLYLDINGTNKVKLTSAGYLGIGTTTPSTALSVAGTSTTNGLVISNIVGSYLATDSSGNVISTSSPISFVTSNYPTYGYASSTYMPLASSSMFALSASSSQWLTNGNNIYYNLGKIGIGTSTPSALLDIRGYTSYPEANYFSISSSSNNNIFNIDSIGNVTIGGETSSAKLSVLLGSDSGLTPTGSATLTGTGAIRLFISGPYMYVTNQTSNSMSVVDISNPTSPTEIATTSTGGLDPIGIYVSGNYAYVANYTSSTLAVINISNPFAPILVATTTTGEGSIPKTVVMSGHYVYTTNNDQTISSIDVSNPLAPTLVATTSIGTIPSDIYILGQYAYTGNTNSTISVIDISNPLAPIQVATTTVGSTPAGGPGSIFISGHYAYTANNDQTISSIDISNPLAPIQVATTTIGGSGADSIYVTGRYAYIVNHLSNSIVVIDISNPTSLRLATTISLGGGLSPYDIYVSGRNIYTANFSANSVTAIDFTGIETSSLFASSLEAGSLVVRSDVVAEGSIKAGTSLSVGTGGILSEGALAVTSTNAPSYFGGKLGIGTSLPSTNLHIQGGLRLTGNFFDSTNATGTLGMVLQSTGTSTLWVDPNLTTPGYYWGTSTLPSSSINWTSVTYGDGLFVAVGSTGDEFIRSYDGVNWATTSVSGTGWRSVTYGDGLFVAVSNGSPYITTSPDGITWTSRTPAQSRDWRLVTYGNDRFVALAWDGSQRAMTSPDGMNWTMATTSANVSFQGLTYGNGLFVAVANNSIITSPDGITWTNRTSPESNSWKSVTYGDGLFVAVSENGTHRVMTSPNGINWTVQTSPINNYYSVTYGDGLYVAVANTTVDGVIVSNDGINWTSRTSSGTGYLMSVTYGNGIFVAVAQGGSSQSMFSGQQFHNITSRNNTYQGGMNIFGNVGIGTSTPSTALTVVGTSTTNGLVISNIVGSYLATDASGNVISTSSPISFVTSNYPTYSYASSTFASTSYVVSTYLPISASTSLAYIPSSSSTLYVPYTGANSNLVLGAFSISSTDATSTNLYSTTIRNFGRTFLADGTSGSPSLTFTDATNMGFYKKDSNTIGIVANGQESMMLSGVTGVGTLAIGNVVPANEKFLITGSGSSDFVRVSSDNSETGQIFIIKRTGNVGIGTTTPETMLVVAGTSTFQDILPGGLYTGNMSTYSIGASTTRWSSVWAQYVNIGTSTWSLGQADTRFGIFNQANGAGTEALTILSGGNVGIGTSTPSQLLSVAGNIQLTGALFDGSNASGTTGMVLQSVGTSTRWVASSSLSILSGGVNGKIAYWTSASTLSAGSMFDNGTVSGVNATSGTVSFNVQGNAGAFDPFNVASSSGTSLLVVKQSGYVGIGTTSPSATLSVLGDATTTSVLAVYGASTNMASGSSIILKTGTASSSMPIGQTAIGGDLTLNTGYGSFASGVGGGGGRSGNIIINPANGNPSTPYGGSAGGSVLVTAGSGAGSFGGGAAGVVTIIAGNGSSGSSASIGGDVTVTAGNAGNSTVRGGYILLNPGQSAGAASTGREGRVGIGTSTPIALLSVMASSSAATSPFIVFNSSTTRIFTILTNGNVGIGTSTPTLPLTVVGDVSFSGSINATSGIKTSFIYGSTSVNKIDLAPATVTVTYTNLIPTMTSASAPYGTVTAGNGSNQGAPYQVFDHSTSTFWQPNVGNSSIQYQFTSAVVINTYQLYTAAPNAGDPTDWIFEGSNNGSSYTTLDTRSGQAIGPSSVGSYQFINSTAYSYYRMTVSNHNANDTLMKIAELTMSTESTTRDVSIAMGSSERMRIMESGAVYILSGLSLGTTTKSLTKLDVYGTLGSAEDIFGISSSSGSRLFTITSAGKVGIGTSTPTANLTASGTIRFTSLGSAGANLTTDSSGNVSVSSDERLKDIQGDYERGLADIMNINPIRYKWKIETGYDASNTYSGFSAQNMELAIPEAVATSSNGYLTLADRPVIAALVNAVKQIGSFISKIQSGIAYLKNIVVETFAVGSQTKPSGITMYDEDTGDAYCVKITNGVLINEFGPCIVYATTTSKGLDYTATVLNTENSSTSTSTDIIISTTTDSISTTTTDVIVSTTTDSGISTTSTSTVEFVNSISTSTDEILPYTENVSSVTTPTEQVVVGGAPTSTPELISTSTSTSTTTDEVATTTEPAMDAIASTTATSTETGGLAASVFGAKISQGTLMIILIIIQMLTILSFGLYVYTRRKHK